MFNYSRNWQNTPVDTRDRMRRHVIFLARISHDGGAPGLFGIALDEPAGSLKNAEGAGEFIGSSTAYFVSTLGRPEVCEPANTSPIKT